MERSVGRVGAAARRGGPGWAVLALGALVAATQAVPARGATYKWVDEKGVVHYTDKIPPEAVNKGSTVLDKQARPVKRIEPAPTAEQLRAREAEEEQKRTAARVQEEMARRDRALLNSYTHEAEIDLARARALATIDAQVDSAQGYVAQLRKRKDDLEARRASAGAKGLPQAQERELEGADRELARQGKLIELKGTERAAAIAKYDADKARWRELRAIAEANAAAAGGARPSSARP